MKNIILKTEYHTAESVRKLFFREGHNLKINQWCLLLN